VFPRRRIYYTGRVAKEEVSIAVRELVEFIMQEGDISPGTPVLQRFQDGIKGHKKIQDSRGEGYRQEVSLSATAESPRTRLTVQGRADGIEETPSGWIIEEIKTTDMEIGEISEDRFPSHWAQARIYGYIWCRDRELESLTLRLTYLSNRGGTISFDKTESAADADAFFTFLTSAYLDWLESFSFTVTGKREAVRKLEFPFREYRPGQRQMAVEVFRTIRDGKVLFAEAPTGTGKTMGALFPAVKALSEGLTDKIFYLTARTVGRIVAEETLAVLADRGMSLSWVSLTAKGSICFLLDDKGGHPPCDPEYCRYARGYYSKIRDVLKEIVRHQGITREVIEEYAEKHQVCPFELSLDASLWVDIIIGDVNYVFDPRAALKRYFQGKKKNYTLLIDEAHNLIDRGRTMFSAEICKETILSLKKGMKTSSPALYKLLDRINRTLIEMRRPLQEKKKSAAGGSSRDELYTTGREKPQELIDCIRECQKSMESMLRWKSRQGMSPEMIDLYYEFSAFVRVSEQYGEDYRTILYYRGREFRVRLYCLDPSRQIDQVLKKQGGTVFFSATLSPVSYYHDLLVREKADILQLPSPYGDHQLFLGIDPGISTRYRDREGGYGPIAERILRFTELHRGNYLIFFPSYSFLERVFEECVRRIAGREEEFPPLIRQFPGMGEEERREFLSRFREPSEDHTGLTAFAVLGGLFGEGIDLRGEALSGAVIIGVGLPGIGAETTLIKEYFDEKDGSGFEHALMYPGVNKVVQAAGRVIRTESDRGAVLLIGERYSRKGYKRCLPGHWSHARTAGFEHLCRSASLFWREQGDPPEDGSGGE